jgi:hypothetical protein
MSSEEKLEYNRCSVREPDEPDEPETPDDYDPCVYGDGTPVNATETCNKIAQVEVVKSNPNQNKYTVSRGTKFNSSSGRYQLQGKTASGEIIRMGIAKTKSEADALWMKCRASASPDCKKLQDNICKSYTETLTKSLKNRNIPVTSRNLYLAWNQGAKGADVILKAAKNPNGDYIVTDPVISSRMQNQAWLKTNDARKFLASMEKYMKQHNFEP